MTEGHGMICYLLQQEKQKHEHQNLVAIVSSNESSTKNSSPIS